MSARCHRAGETPRTCPALPLAGAARRSRGGLRRFYIARRSDGRHGRARGRRGAGLSVMPGLWERLGDGERGSLESSDCESLGSASGSEGGERGPESCGGRGDWARGEPGGVEPRGGRGGLWGARGRYAAAKRPPDPRADLSRPADPERTSLPDLELLHDPEDELLSARLLELVQAALGSAPLGSRRRSRLLMPAQLAAQLRSELLRLACSEPCGLRGALLDLCVEHGKACHDVGRIAADPAVVPTFQLTLVLRLDSRLWPKIQGLLASAPALSPAFGQSLKLSTGFRVMKKKLYSSEQLLVEEC